MAADGRQITLLGLLDLSAAFDCVDHDILLTRLQSGLVLSGAVLRWIQSFLSNRTQQVALTSLLRAYSVNQVLLFIIIIYCTKM